MTKILSAYLAGSLTVAATIVATGAQATGLLGTGAGILGVALIALLASPSRLRKTASILAGTADLWERRLAPAAATAERASSRRSCGPRKRDLSPLQQDVAAALVNLGAAKPQAVEAVSAAGEWNTFPELFRAAHRCLPASRTRRSR
jgi:hypothetical protein